MSKKQRQQSRSENQTGTNAAPEDNKWVLDSKLEPGTLRFMAHVIEDGLNAGLRTEEDFIRHFPPADIMMGLKDRPDLRANILVPTTGVRAKIASKKTAESAGHDLQISLDEGETDAALIVSLFSPDDRVRYLDKARLWKYIIEPEFWKVDASRRGEFDNAKAHLSFIMDRAIEDGMLNYREIVEGVTVEKLVTHLPLNEIQSLIEHALSNSHTGKAFTEQDLLRAVPTRQLVEHVPLAVLWESVICPRVAERNGLTAGAQNAPQRPVTPEAPAVTDTDEELIGVVEVDEELVHLETVNEGGQYSPNYGATWTGTAR